MQVVHGPQRLAEGVLTQVASLLAVDCAGILILRDLGAYAVSQGWDVAKENYEGLRVSFGAGEGDGWFLLRMSLHDPLMPLNIESNSTGGVHAIAQKLYSFLSPYDKLDTSALKNV